MCKNYLSLHFYFFRIVPQNTGGVAEWLNALVLKTSVSSRAPGVRIPPPPQLALLLNNLHGCYTNTTLIGSLKFADFAFLLINLLTFHSQNIFQLVLYALPHPLNNIHRINCDLSPYSIVT